MKTSKLIGQGYYTDSGYCTPEQELLIRLKSVLRGYNAGLTSLPSFNALIEEIDDVFKIEEAQK